MREPAGLKAREDHWWYGLGCATNSCIDATDYNDILQRVRDFLTCVFRWRDGESEFEARERAEFIVPAEWDVFSTDDGVLEGDKIQALHLSRVHSVLQSLISVRASPLPEECAPYPESGQVLLYNLGRIGCVSYDGDDCQDDPDWSADRNSGSCVDVWAEAGWFRREDPICEFPYEQEDCAGGNSYFAYQRYSPSHHQNFWWGPACTYRHCTPPWADWWVDNHDDVRYFDIPVPGDIICKCDFDVLNFFLDCLGPNCCTGEEVFNPEYGPIRHWGAIEAWGDYEVRQPGSSPVASTHENVRFTSKYESSADIHKWENHMTNSKTYTSGGNGINDMGNYDGVVVLI
jgi:hypothetical protein